MSDRRETHAGVDEHVWSLLEARPELADLAAVGPVLTTGALMSA